ncbi:aldo/keto reductase [Alsobacter sp. SYSU BS001988]
MTDPGERVTLGSRDLEVCRLGFGSAPLGGLLRATSGNDADAAVAAALAAGIFYFDTAPQYGGGLAEERLGSALKAVDRAKVVVSTKVGKLVTRDASAGAVSGFPGAPPHRISYDYCYDGVMRSLDASLERTGLNGFDIVLVHDVNRKYHGDDVMDRLDEALRGACLALARLRDQGVIRAFGPASNELDVMQRFVQEADIDCIMLPQRFTLLDRSAGAELLPTCDARGVGVLLAAPFDSGVLATGLVEGATYNYQPVTPEVAVKVGLIERLCKRHAVPLAAAALQFGFRHPAVCSVVTGMRSADEVSRNTDLMRHPISEEFWIEMDQL